MRILSAKDPRYHPSGYHFGSVWPLFTGWASVSEYRYHRPIPAYANLLANVLVTRSGSPGRTTEVLSGSYFDALSRSSPHQIWSSAMVVSPILRGMMGLEPDAPAHTLNFAPHLPASWNHFQLRNVWVGETRCNLNYKRSANQILLNLDVTGDELKLHFSPAIAPRARVLSVAVDGRPAKYYVRANSEDQHIEIDLRTGARTIVLIRLRRDFDLEPPVANPALGQKSGGVRVVAESWTASHGRLDLQMYGVEGSIYDFPLRGAEQIGRVEGATLVRDARRQKVLRVQFPIGDQACYVKKSVVIHFRD